MANTKISSLTAGTAQGTDLIPAARSGANYALKASDIAALAGAQIVKAGLLGQYQFTEGSGSTLNDISGNGNNGTLGSSTHAPTWVAGGGLSFAHSSQQTVAFPAALNAALTVQIVVAFNTTASVGSMDLMASTVGSPNGISLHVNNNNNFPNHSGGGNAAFSNPGTTVFGTLEIQSAMPADGLGMLTYVLGTAGNSNYDTVYWNAGLSAAMTAQLRSGGVAGGAGVFQLGGSSIDASYFGGTVYYMLVYSGVLTQAQIAQNFAAVSALIQARQGINLTGPKVSYSAGNQFIADGDSLTQGTNASNPYTTALSLNGTWNIGNIGIPGQTIQTMAGQVQNTVIPALAANAPNRVCVVWAGTNDVSTGTSAAQTLYYLQSYCNQVRAAGNKVIVCTMISRTGQDTNKNSYNALIRANWHAFADGLADLAANANLGADGANTNSTYFGTDHIHLTATGYAIVTAIVQQAVNRLYGNRDLSSASTYSASATQADKDYIILLTGTTASQTLTLETSIGYTGQDVTIMNNSTQTWTIAAASGETINGSSTATLTAGSTMKLTSVLTGASSGGSNWLRLQ